MHPRRKQRLWLVLFIVLGSSVLVGLTLFALRQNINLFFSPQQIVRGEAPHGANLRCAGLVVKGSVKRDPSSLKVAFDLTDNKAVVTVHYTGILPDLFREGQGIMVTGQLDDAGIFQATEVLAKHDENYMPPEMKAIMEQGGHPTAIPPTMKERVQ